MINLFSKKAVVLLVMLLTFSLIAVGCGGGDEVTGNIEVRGSDTMVNLGQSLAEAYMEEQTGVAVSVTGGGSGTGIAALIDDRVDIANVSRAMSESEIEQANNNNVDPFEVVIGMDGLAVFANQDLGIEELTMDEVGAIFRGEITNWSEVGGPDAEISMYGRQSNSGTYVFFRDNVLGDDFSDDVRRMNGTAQIVEGVRSDNRAIGYGGIGYTVDSNNEVEDGLTVISIALDEDSEYATPLEPENVETGEYPIARPLYNYFNGQPEGAQLDYIEFILSEAGQEVAVSTGFYPVSPEYQEFNAEQLQ
ncbi:PstS family phosphate ABC transporter substrate-binding protein [Fuchsiella alkaliacetigena]|uniref:PstS family phosphate ABC transporter substrate-binding protein n=1 Tax=Fuchsiella alkaliacetigena TaxID=957042 RepID=UPI00200B9B4E|nr:PstS family phosphate ABC transporter substrate-binding protein [Fuchsiella alkaliacetigena]MCK8823686.1 PstS family phosphate ABC transporter substrate-binding protein [Fuchsiella alkaliacetigena]